jgi:transaldolase/glucose-6-phosphate isomerase
MYLPTDNNAANEAKLAALKAADHPVISIKVTDKIALGGEFYRWEIATAVAGMVIGINPFDQPNVAESKKNTSNLLDEWQKNGSFKPGDPLVTADGFAVYGGMQVDAIKGKKTIADVLTAFGGLAHAGDYVAFLPYFLMTDARAKALQAWRMKLRDKLKETTTLLNGPRYLHSTGQLHKGGPATGLYIILVSDEKKELAIPDAKYGFATLHEAQSLGDYRSLDDKGRRVIRINLGSDTDKGLEKLTGLLS